ncbi:S-adenosyl-L-methionine-dependent methyltransferase [Pseudomassariella vexata]|uniref:S-adenosyl-L-methionine-dependent methyltransferase n=1 Tax=Pseudomassariella vexata TaxID=1141098 RepID=A0A1Y2EIA7_9PEZI|nr:S-adenosyl-L-methionine-dependent methyltransferase [Pseudomassariella vexata]ORY71308.1 S-adenosyl-L-methionine-dependent methyltransferase [Pseudomassariella vexata]
MDNNWQPDDFFSGDNDSPRVPSGESIIEPDSVTGHDGRTYHGYKQGKYFLPNDPAEQDRLDMQHANLTLLLEGKLACAPVYNPEWIMDVATGTGIWALDFARQNPHSKVVGSDLSKIQPDLETSVPNCEFIKEDAEEEWIYDHKFDYVHLRLCVSCFNDHRTVMKHAFDNLNPGGWIEYQDSTADPYRYLGTAEGSAFKRWADLFLSSGAALGRDMLVTNKYEGWLIETGFVDVVEKRLPWPLSPWPDNPRLREVGRFNRTTWPFMATRKILVSGSGLPEQQVDQIIADAKRELADVRNMFFVPFWIVYGRKPFDWEVKKLTANIEHTGENESGGERIAPVPDKSQGS